MRARQETGAGTRAKPFVVNSEWIEYAHGPGAESGNPLATELCDMLGRDVKSIKLTKREHVAEVMDVAELYTFGSAVQDDERLWFRLYPNKLIKRAREWLRESSSTTAPMDK